MARSILAALAGILVIMIRIALVSLAEGQQETWYPAIETPFKLERKEVRRYNISVMLVGILVNNRKETTR